MERVPTSTLLALALALAGVLAAPMGAQAHCDTLDGPVVNAARRALDSGDINLALVWVRKADEPEIRQAFQKARSVRRTGAEARELADLYFFENLVRVHRAGEGAPYTGLKPTGQVEPVVAAADRAIQTGQLPPLAHLIGERTEQGLHRHFDAVVGSRKYDPADVEAGRAHARAYVEFVHYAERLYGAGETLAPEAVPQHAPTHTH